MSGNKTQQLYQICLENIVHNAEFWLEFKNSQEKSSTFCSPFDNLPSSLQQDLLDTYEHVHGLPGRNNFWLERQEKWRLFITRHITKLTITEYTEKTSLVHIAAVCRNVKHLEVKNVQEALPYLKAVAPCLSSVLSLNFETMAHVNSASLKYIRSHCPNLRTLGLRSCFLNDKAVGNLKQVSTLTKMDLRDTEVTASGLCSVLKNNPQLRTLQHSEVVRAIYKMHSCKTWFVRMEATFLSTPTWYQLREIEIELTQKDNASMLTVVASVCPEIERVRVEFDSRSSPFALIPLAKMECLRELDIQCVADGQRKTWAEQMSEQLDETTLFHGSIVPILEARGSQLHTVTLEGVGGISMDVLQHYCPNIVCLGLYYNVYVPHAFTVPSNVMDYKPFPSLRRLMFGSNAGNDDFCPAYLKWLLANKDLEELSLSGSPLFTDELFNFAFTKSCSFPLLRRLELDYCNIPTEVITEFLDRCGRQSLRELSICGPFVREQASPVLCYIICEKLDVQLEAYFYSFIKMKKRMVRYKQDLNFISSKSEYASPRHAVRESCNCLECHPLRCGYEPCTMDYGEWSERSCFAHHLALHP